MAVGNIRASIDVGTVALQDRDGFSGVSIGVKTMRRNYLLHQLDASGVGCQKWAQCNQFFLQMLIFL
jgi:hypothetical protein